MKTETKPAATLRESLEAKDLEGYSIIRAIGVAMGDQDGPSLEREVSDALGGTEFQVPTNLPMHASALNSSVSSRGTELIFTAPGTFVEYLYARTRVRELGATMLPGLVGPLDVPKQTGSGGATWVAEEPGSDTSETNVTTDAVQLAPKTLRTTQAVTRQLIGLSRLAARSNPLLQAEALVRRDLAQSFGVALDLAAINGSGASNEPTGLLNTSGIGDVAGGTNGAVPSWDNIVQLEYEVAVDDADYAPMGYLSTPGIRRKLKTVERASGSGFIWDGNEMNGYQALASTQVPSNLTKGTATNAHAVIFGAWSELVIGEWGAIDIIYDPYAQKQKGVVEITADYSVDVALRHPEAFAAMQDALTA